MFSQFIKGKIFIAIDAANIEHSAKDLKMKIRYKKLYDFFAKQTDFLQINFYSARFDSDSHNRFLTFLKKNNFKIITKAVKIIKDSDKGDIRKANFDVEITADTLIKMKEFETFVLFSGDSDFDYLIKLLKAGGKKVIIVSSKYHVSKELIMSCSKYFDIKKFKGIFLEKQKSPSFSTGG